MPKIQLDNAVVIGGTGVIGNATRKLFGIKDYFALNDSTLTLKEIAETKRYVFLCLPTPDNEHGYETDHIFQIIKQIEDYHGGQKIYINRSTVIPGTTRMMNEKLGISWILHNPEFLTMRTIDDDTFNPDLVVVGNDEVKSFGEEVIDLYKQALGKKMPKHILTTTDNSEMIKLAINNFYAMKVIFANQLYDVCDVEGGNLDYEVIKDALYKRKWIGKNHLDVWHDDKRGFSGMCLPKDNRAFNRVYQKPLLQLVERLNDEYLAKKRKK